jgi:RNA polymerase I-specific transcription initiation factor RRN6
MAKPSLNDLNYGHFGQAAFDLENGSWNFGRKIGQRNHLIQLETWKKVLAPAIKFDQTGIPEHAQNIRNAQLSARALGRSNPEITPSLEFLPKLAVTSAAVTSIVRAYNPAIGPLLSYGSFTFRDHHENPRRVVALPAGECGNILRLVALRKEKHGWGSDKSIWIEGPSIVDEESGYWMEDAAPIQQVCFAQGDMRSAFLATRYPTKTVLFRPIYRADRTPSKRNKYYELPNSKIDAQPILEINVEQTGGVPHADVTFNPDYQRQIGIVDQKGNWSVWDIEGGRREGKSYALTCAALGTVTSQEPDHSEELEDADSITRDDGWAKILWIGDVNTILVFNRRTTGIFDIRSKAFTSLKCAELIPKRSADWILDVKPHPRNKRQFFVLTSSRLFLMAVISLNDLSNNDGATAGAAVLIAWAHFQGLDDITLQLYVPTTSDEGDFLELNIAKFKLLTFCQTLWYSCILVSALSSWSSGSKTATPIPRCPSQARIRLCCGSIANCSMQRKDPSTSRIFIWSHSTLRKVITQSTKLKMDTSTPAPTSASTVCPQCYPILVFIKPYSIHRSLISKVRDNHHLL